MASKKEKEIPVNLFVATRVNDKQWWIRTPLDKNWLRLQPNIGPWFTHNEARAKDLADKLNEVFGLPDPSY